MRRIMRSVWRVSDFWLSIYALPEKPVESQIDSSLVNEHFCFSLMKPVMRSCHTNGPIQSLLLPTGVW